MDTHFVHADMRKVELTNLAVVQYACISISLFGYVKAWFTICCLQMA